MRLTLLGLALGYGGSALAIALFAPEIGVAAMAALVWWGGAVLSIASGLGLALVEARVEARPRRAPARRQALQ